MSDLRGGVGIYGLILGGCIAGTGVWGMLSDHLGVGFVLLIAGVCLMAVVGAASDWSGSS